MLELIKVSNHVDWKKSILIKGHSNAKLQNWEEEEERDSWKGGRKEGRKGGQRAGGRT